MEPPGGIFAFLNRRFRRWAGFGTGKRLNSKFKQIAMISQIIFYEK